MAHETHNLLWVVLKTLGKSYTRLIFYKLKVLHVDDIVSVNIAAFMHRAFYKELPQRIHGAKKLRGISTLSLKDQNTGIICKLI